MRQPLKIRVSSAAPQLPWAGRRPVPTRAIPVDVFVEGKDLPVRAWALPAKGHYSLSLEVPRVPEDRTFRLGLGSSVKPPVAAPDLHIPRSPARDKPPGDAQPSRSIGVWVPWLVVACGVAMLLLGAAGLPDLFSSPALMPAVSAASVPRPGPAAATPDDGICAVQPTSLQTSAASCTQESAASPDPAPAVVAPAEHTAEQQVNAATVVSAPRLINAAGEVTLVVPFDGPGAATRTYRLASPAGVAFIVPGARLTFAAGNHRLDRPELLLLSARPLKEGAHFKVYFNGQHRPYRVRLAQGQIRLTVKSGDAAAANKSIGPLEVRREWDTQTLVIPIQGSAQGLVSYELREPHSLAINLPRAALAMPLGHYPLSDGQFRHFHARVRGSGVHLRVFFSGPLPRYNVDADSGELRISIQP